MGSDVIMGKRPCLKVGFGKGNPRILKSRLIDVGLGISPTNLGYPHQFVEGMIWGALKKDLFASSSETQSFSDMPGPDRNHRKTARQVGEAARLISS